LRITTTYIKATLHNVATALVALTGEPLGESDSTGSHGHRGTAALEAYGAASFCLA
jgi:hypothetical protein